MDFKRDQVSTSKSLSQQKRARARDGRKCGFKA